MLVQVSEIQKQTKQDDESNKINNGKIKIEQMKESLGGYFNIFSVRCTGYMWMQFLIKTNEYFLKNDGPKYIQL